jgi:hypothetical protein
VIRAEYFQFVQDTQQSIGMHAHVADAHREIVFAEFLDMILYLKILLIN